MRPGTTLFLADGRTVTVRLRRRFWLDRSFLIAASRGEYRLDYDARSESITVWLERRLEGGAWVADRRYLQTIQRRDVAQVRGYHFWFQPHYIFALGSLWVQLDVRIWPWFTMKGFMIRIGEMVAYAEGRFSDLSPPPGPPFGDVWDRELDSFPQVPV